MAATRHPIHSAPPEGAKVLPVRYEGDRWIPTDRRQDQPVAPPFPEDLLGPAIMRRVQEQRSDALPVC